MLFAAEASPPQVWAVEDHGIQITWGALPPGPIRAQARTTSGAKHQQTAGSIVATEHAGGPGSLVLSSLPSDTLITVDLRWGEAGWGGGSVMLTAKTLPRPRGQELTRFATISDMHLGAESWGALRTMKDTSGHPVAHPMRCATAAVTEAVAWGAECLIIKGDAAEDESAHYFELVGDLVDQFPDLPMLLIPGNHDVHAGGKNLPASVGKRELPYIRRVDHIDLPGIRLIAADTTVPGRGFGSVDRVRQPIVERAGESEHAVFVAVHQQLQKTRLPRQWPIGVPAPGSLHLIDALDQIRQPTVISSGHSHRNRSWNRGSVLVSEVGSTKDWPNVWGGYVVHEGGIRQVLRRIASPEAISWSEYSRGALNGLWSHWSPGKLEQRCLVKEFPAS